MYSTVKFLVVYILFVNLSIINLHSHFLFFFLLKCFPLFTSLFLPNHQPLFLLLTIFLILRPLFALTIICPSIFHHPSPFYISLYSYNFCYEIAQTFLDTFETYSNFDLKSGGAFSSLILDGDDDDDDDVDKVLHLDLVDSSPPSSPSVDTVVPPKAETFI